ncbi:thioredoxin family protein [Pendulispora rubella]|uniref:Thioredoxin n=1 Tax=Pendulispora rubella TaxID=2741070 RepID=A0ABZ2L5V3_9BACT
MAGENVIELTDATFDREVLEAELPVLVDFTATWCQPCITIGAMVAEIADENVGRYKVAKVDIDDCPEIAKRYGIRGVPTVIVFESGAKKRQYVGMTNRETLLKLLEA